jgi:SAM-dependent methyltransferase
LNYFDSQNAAKRYSAARPYFHPLVIEKIKNYIGIATPVSQVLDVAYGTGQSTVALKEIAKEIAGIDSSEEMLALAPRDDRIRYVRASAEDLPFAEESFDLITVSEAFHWFERDTFLAEASRVLRRSGWLIVYGFRSGGGMKYDPDYDRWFDEEFAPRYPTPPRNWARLTEAEARRHGFAFVGQEGYSHEVPFSLEEQVNYLMSQSRVLAAIGEDKEDEESVRRWLTDTQAPFFEGPRATFVFEGSIDYLWRDTSGGREKT